MIKVIFKIISALKLWLASTNYSAIILLHLQTHSLKNFSVVVLHVFTLISLNTLLTNTLRMKDPFIQLIHLFLHSILMIRPTFPKHFFTLRFVFCYATPKFLPVSRAQDIKKGRRLRTTDDPEESPKPKARHYYKAAGVGEQLQLFSTFG